MCEPPSRLRFGLAGGQLGGIAAAPIGSSHHRMIALFTKAISKARIMNEQHKGTDLQLWLEADETRSRPYRARRLRKLLEAIEIPEVGMFFSGGDASCQAFNELRLAYIHGLYLSTVLLTLACIEHEIAGRLYAAGWNKAITARLEDLLHEAHSRSMITDVELAVFQKLRDIRNSYVHHRGFDHPSTLVRRAITRETSLDDVLQEDAESAIKALGTFFERRSGF